MPGDPLTPGEAENIICIFTVVDFGGSRAGKGGWGLLWRHGCSKINKRSRRSSLFLHLGRISGESAEFFERVNAVLQKQQNMLQAAQTEVTSNRASTFPSVTPFTLWPRRHRFLLPSVTVKEVFKLKPASYIKTLLSLWFYFRPLSVREGPPRCRRPPSMWTSPSSPTESAGRRCASAPFLS